MKIDREAPIGVFDSGVGGLTVAREIMRNLPSEKIVYFGDTARVPYGSKSKETIIRYSRQIIRFLQQQQVKAIVVACNTASAFALDAVRDEFDIPIIGVIEPGAKVAAAQTRNKRVGIIGTVGTVGSGIHAEYLKHLDPEITVFGKACPLFVPLVEEGWLHDPVTDEVAARYLKELQDKQVDTLILGCTHYPLLMDKIRQFTPDHIRIVAQGEYVAQSLRNYLSRHPEMDARCTQGGNCRFLTTESKSKFEESASIFLRQEEMQVESIALE